MNSFAGGMESPADVIPGTARFPGGLESGRFGLAVPGLSVGPLPEVRRRSTGPGGVSEEEGGAQRAWFEGDFDPFTVWLDAAEHSPEAGAHSLRHIAPALQPFLAFPAVELYIGAL